MHHLLALVLACEAFELACDSPQLSMAQVLGASACFVLGHLGAGFCFKRV